jgi:adenylyl-sulfate kinase
LAHTISAATPFVLWFTGLPGAGKSTLARLAAVELEQRGRHVELLDGDVVRTHLSRDLGYSRADRETNIERIAWVSSRLVRAGAVVVVAAIAPYAGSRRRARELVEEQGAFVEVHVATPLEECMRRDPKGLYARAAAGEVANVTGLDDPYEQPEAPELRLDTTGVEPAESLRDVLGTLRGLGLLAEEG